MTRHTVCSLSHLSETECDKLNIAIEYKDDGTISKIYVMVKDRLIADDIVTTFNSCRKG